MTAIGKPAQVMDALFAHTALLETTGPMLPISFPEAKNADGTAFAPPANGKYLRVSIFPNLPKWEGLANGLMDQGLLQISVVWPKLEGLIAPANVVGQIKDHFDKQTVLVSGSTRVKVSNEPWHSPPLTEATDIAIPVTIPWTA